MKTICICGAFRLWDKPKGGQEIKTCIIAEALEKKYGEIYKIDTLSHGGRIQLLLQLFGSFFFCKNIIILPAQNGIKILSRLLSILNMVFKKKIHYVVIGGWLQDLLPKYPKVNNALKKFTGIYVETQTMMDRLIEQGLNNVNIMRNCKPLSLINIDNLSNNFNEPYKLVSFSRVTEKKGIGIAANVVMSINKKYKREVYKLDIYGPIDDEDKCWFLNLQKTFTDSIKYKGIVPYNRSVEVLSKYFALLFPTQYYTEGIPGTIIDAYAAGVPVIASRWKSYNDLITDCKTGYGYSFGKTEELENILDMILHDPDMIIHLKANCLKQAQDYMPQNALKPLFDNIEG